MLTTAALAAADRLIATLMTLVDAIYPIALAGSTPTLPAQAAHTLFIRLSTLIATLIRISTFGIRAKPIATTPARIDPAPTARRAQSGPTQSLPRRPGWLLAALPDIAPAIAADLAAILADPALATLLAAAPSLNRTLRGLLRGLDLTATQPPPSPCTPPRRPPRPEPHHAPAAQPGPATPHTDTPPSQAAVPKFTPPNKPLPTSNSLRNRNDLYRQLVR